MRILQSLLCLCFLVANPLSAQGSIRSFIPFGSAAGNAASIGDVDGDGVSDLAVATPLATLVGIFSGDDSALLSSWTMSTPLLDPALVGVSDMDGDNVPDVAVGMGNGSLNYSAAPVEVRSGADGSVIVSIPQHQLACGFGFALNRLGDLDADGVPELAISAPLASSDGFSLNGAVRIHSGADGSFIDEVVGAAHSAAHGLDVAALGDIDGDGVSDFAVVSLRLGGTVDVYSGATRTLVSSLSLGGNFLGFPAMTGRVLGLKAGLDHDGNGAPDYVVSKSTHDPSGGTSDAGAVFIVEAATANVIATLSGSPGARLGADMDVTDLNGDGHEDIVCVRGAAQELVVHSGLTLNPVWDTAASLNDIAGVTAIDDANGDGSPDLALRVPSTSPQLAGALQIVGGGPWLGVHGRTWVGAASPEDILTVNGTAGGAVRRVDIGVGDAFSVSIGQPSLNPTSADHAIFGRLGCPLETEVTGLGTMGNMAFPPAPAALATPFLFTLASTVALPGGRLVAAGPTPWSLDATTGVPVPVTFTLQAVVDQGSGDLKVTNAVIVRVR